MKNPGEHKIKERTMLDIYLSIVGRYKDYVKLNDCVQPDFELIFQEKKVGVDLFRCTGEDNEIINKIEKNNFGKGLSADDIKMNTEVSFSHCYNRYDYYDLDGTVGIASGLYSVTAEKNRYANKVIDKYIKYKGKFSLHDEFVVLSDCNNVNITSTLDAQNVYDFAKELCPELSGFELAILFEDDNGKWSVYENIY